MKKIILSIFLSIFCLYSVGCSTPKQPMNKNEANIALMNYIVCTLYMHHSLNGIQNLVLIIHLMMEYFQQSKV